MGDRTEPASPAAPPASAPGAVNAPGAVDASVGALLAGKYAVGRMIGRGGCGAVHEGRHVELGRVLAIKLIDRALVENPEVVARFRQEAKATSAVLSDHIVQVFDVGEDPEHGLFMVMEQLVGEDLEVRLARVGAVPVALAVDIAAQVARGLSRAHAAGIVHRDLKPANVFLATRDDGTTIAKILDFGISKLLHPDAPRHSVPPGAPDAPLASGNAADRREGITRFGTALGTPQYMSPEQAQGLAVDHRTDVWALGTVLFEMLAGRPAYAEESDPRRTIAAIVEGAPPALQALAPHVPDEVAAIVDDALEREVSRRLPDCETFARRLVDATSRPPAEPLDAPVLVLDDAAAGSSLDEGPIVDVTELAPVDEASPIASRREVLPVEEPAGLRHEAPKRTPARPRRRWLGIVALLVVVGAVLAAGALLVRDGPQKGIDVPPALEPSTAASTGSASPTSSTAPRPKPRPNTKPTKPSPKTKPSTSASVSASTGKGFGAAGVATQY